MPAIATPCVRICEIDPAAGLCRGCGRTLKEIGGWLTLSDAERQAVMMQLPGRMARLSARAPA